MILRSQVSPLLLILHWWHHSISHSITLSPSFFATTADKHNDVDRVADPISLEKIAFVFDAPWMDDETQGPALAAVSLGDYLALNVDPVSKEDGSLIYEHGELYRIEGAAFSLKEKATRHNRHASNQTEFHVTRYYKVSRDHETGDYKRVHPETGLIGGAPAEEYIYASEKLWEACESGDSQIEQMRQYIQWGADVNYELNNRSCLHQATHHNQADAVKLLSDHGAESSVRYQTL